MGIALSLIPLKNAFAGTKLFNETTENLSRARDFGNFRYIYGNNTYANEFFAFLANVFHLYREKELHKLITILSQKNISDKTIYNQLQAMLPDIKPFLADITYALPALSKQKNIIAEQTAQLLDTDKTYQGYLEVGSTGRYLDSLEERLDIQGETFFLAERSATYSPVDMIDRGQILKAGADIALSNYRSEINKHIPNGSVDLATVYIGFHHCPVDLRESFIGSIRAAMSKNGLLILRDHDAHSDKMWRMVALAHDVFNMGTNETWAYNEAELRLFYSLDELEIMMNKYGFRSDGRKLYQSGDPTRNALMIFRKI